MMTAAKKRKNGKRAVSIALFALAAIFLMISICGYVIRGTETTGNNLNSMRISAVLHTASGGIADDIASQANAAKLKELRARSDFRSLGMDEVKRLCAEAEEAARAEAESKYSNLENVDTSALPEKIDALAEALDVYYTLLDQQRAEYAALYTDLFEAVTEWSEVTDGQEEEGIFAALVQKLPALGEEDNAYLRDSFVELAMDMAAEEKAKNEEELYAQLSNALVGAVIDWNAFSEVSADDEALWLELTGLLPALTETPQFRDRLLAEVRTRIDAAAQTEGAEASTVNETAAMSEETVEEAAVEVNYAYFAENDALLAVKEPVDVAYEALWSELVVIIPDLSQLNSKMQASVKESIEMTVYSEKLDFSTRYDIYAAEKADSVLAGSDALMMRLAALAEKLLIAGIAVLLLAFVCMFWRPISKRLGVPRTIITLFFVYLCLAAELYSISVPLMLGNVLERVGMYGILVLAMLPGIQCGIGLNMGMTIGCVSGLLATIIALQYDMTGVTALVFSCVLGALIAIPLGWAYSKLLNRMKGNEMTISTYVGFSFVSLMCIAWMLLPFTNPKIIWLLCGRGLRVTHSLLGSFAHLLDNLWAFNLFGADVPTGLLLFFLLCCGIMWLFSRSRIGIAMTAAGSNPRFAEASGINVDSMRTIGTVLSTMIAAVGIVIYSQAFGYAQLYTAPRQLGFIAASAILIGGATVSKAKVGHVIIGVFLFEGVLALGQQIANSVVAGGGLSEVMRIMISNGIILYALTQSGGASNE